MKFARINGVVLHYADSGPGTAPALVFSNSLGTDFRIWDGLLERIGAPFRVVRYDKRGHGLSEAPDAPYKMEEHVGDLAGLLDHLGVQSAIVCGLSVGGIIAQGLSAARPELVRALILCDTAHKIGPPEMWDDRIAQARAGGIEALAETILQRWFSEDLRGNRPDELMGWRNMLVRTPLAGYIGTSAAIRDSDMTEAAQAVQVPTLCVVGKEDGSTPPDLVRTLAGLIAGAQFEIIEGAGHLPCIERPDELAALINDFFQETGLV
ncbi:3-oxoadipate enol-lactonase [Denitrobaculum tricleocarpae]|uniref:3-oxoadipate enol-lactonase n=1 Tax=Denitrobaculum tricleocarpae TaxID=2591009 RepID=A0A545TYK5_9PROT|nr:3-oxoadipate enol-lactonase [Denitrobaculum tricleocarpae]TQV82281.1 3-oxoadipate enol-lactonase [Denitrobaculum tricleocarpae]